jgi:glutamate dehydrogenase (NADP+)
MLQNGVSLVAEGAHGPTCSEGVKIFLDSNILYAPGKAASAGGAAISGLEMAQNSMRISWTKEEMDSRLSGIIKNIHSACLQYADRFGTPGNYVNGANIGGFLKVADAMIDQGLI